MPRRLSWVLVLSGCTGPVPVFVVSTADIGRPPDEPAAETRAILDEAFGGWGIAWASSDSIDGAVELTLTGFDERAEVHGFNVRAGRCDRSIHVEPDALLLAHEVGHVFGLEPDVAGLDEEGHDAEPGRIMSHPMLGWTATDQQLQIVQEDADRFSRCRR